MTGICGFLWTGVLILKQLGVRYDNRFRIAGEFLGYDFLAPLAAMVANGSPVNRNDFPDFMTYAAGLLEKHGPPPTSKEEAEIRDAAYRELEATSFDGAIGVLRTFTF